jgi:hypothetical protein
MLKTFVIFNVSEIPLINFDEVFETSEHTLRLSVDGTKTFVKWQGDPPPSVLTLTTKSPYYDIDEILVILATEEWTLTSMP